MSGACGCGAESEAGAERRWPFPVGGSSGTRDGTQGRGGSPAPQACSHQAPTAETGCSEPTLCARWLWCPQCQGHVSWDRGGVCIDFQSQSLALLTLLSSPASLSATLKVCTEETARPPRSRVLASGTGNNFIWEMR